MAIRKRKPGDPLSIYASEWNALADLSQPAVAQLRGPLGFAAQAVTVLVQNLTGVDLDRYYCIGLGQPLWSLQADGSTDLILAGLAADPLKPVGILAEPIANTLFGRVWIHGLAYAAVGPGAGISATPAATGNRLTPGPGSVRLLGSPSPSTELLLPCCWGWSNVEGWGSQAPVVFPAARRRRYRTRFLRGRSICWILSPETTIRPIGRSSFPTAPVSRCLKGISFSGNRLVASFGSTWMIARRRHGWLFSWHWGAGTGTVTSPGMVTDTGTGNGSAVRIASSPNAINAIAKVSLIWILR